MSPRRQALARGLIALSMIPMALAGAPGCGSAAPAVVVTGPFTDEHRLAFENGLDGIDNPTLLEGAWLRDWEDDIDRRVSLSDAVALVQIITLRTDVDLDRRETFRLVAKVDRARHGDLPSEITLISRQSDPGYASVRSNTEHILNQHYVLFLKWADEDGHVIARWHLSPAADRVMRRVNTLVERRHTPTDERRRVIVREHDGQASDEESFEE